jgi:hypothetical protein
MQGPQGCRCVFGLLFILGVLEGPVAASDDCRPCDEAIGRALKLLPRRPEKVVVVDVDRTTALLRGKLEHADAFVTTGERVVYLRKQGLAMQQALKGHPFFDHVLAAVIWHEMAHIDGGDERAARKAEEELWKQYVIGRRIATDRGLEYLELLQRRPR